MFGIEINFKDGSKDWVDPVEDEPYEKNSKLFVTNNCYTYFYYIEKVEKWFKYDLCKKCFFDTRTYGCTDQCKKEG